MNDPKYPGLYQINTRVWLNERSKAIGRTATLDDIPDETVDQLASPGVDWIWLLGVWQTGDAGREVSRSRPEWLAEYRHVLPDLTDDDICGSCFAITDYRAHQNLGGDGALARFRKRLAARGLKLMLDFVPNHMAPDHPWVREHPEYMVIGTEEDIARAPENYFRAETVHGSFVLAHGRDPYFPGWPDTVQLNYGRPELRTEMKNVLKRIAGQCDGVRCDMAMLILPDVFMRTWRIGAEDFWPEAIADVRRDHPDFVFLAEVYWDLEWELQQQGFDYTYDKRLYDRLRLRHAKPTRDHLIADLSFQNKLCRFLENHDEPRAATVFDPDAHEASAVLSFLSPGLRFFQEGQFEGRKVRVPVHLCRRPNEPIDTRLQDFYQKLLPVVSLPVFRNGDWRLLTCLSAWPGNSTWDGFIAFAWTGSDGGRHVVVANFSSNRGQSLIPLPYEEFQRGRILLTDLMTSASEERDGEGLANPGLYLDLPAMGYRVYELRVKN